MFPPHVQLERAKRHHNIVRILSQVQILEYKTFRNKYCAECWRYSVYQIMKIKSRLLLDISIIY